MNRYMQLIFAPLLRPQVPATGTGPQGKASLQKAGTALPDMPTNKDNMNNETPMNRNITLIIGPTTWTATPEDNPAARAFAGLLPLTLDMSELNGNEKYRPLPARLPTQGQPAGTILAGDLKL